MNKLIHYTLNVHAVTTKLHLFTVTLDVHQIQVKLLVKTFLIKIQRSFLKGEGGTQLCTRNCVHKGELRPGGTKPGLVNYS